jgi:16S rRNA (adenine1518-N6/adenine1519-N6)-dimethyltransferase
MELQLTDKDTLIYILRKYRLHSIKHFGQHFLVNQDALELIITTANIQKTDTIIEIGTGTGVLTRELAQYAKNVITYEIDTQLSRLLTETVGEYTNVDLRFEDFVTAQQANASMPDSTSFKLVANLPYNIATHIIGQLATATNPPQTMTVLLQREVAEKITAKPPHATYLSNFIEVYGVAQLIKLIKPGSFYPSPKVDSAILHITRHTQPSTSNILPILHDIPAFSRFLHRGFASPRKMLNKPFSVEELNQASIEPNLRPENLTLAEWITLYQITKE